MTQVPRFRMSQFLNGPHDQRGSFARSDAHQLRVAGICVDPEDLATETIAAKIGLPAEQVFKTLVARGDRNGICMAVIPGKAELDLKALAQATRDRNRAARL